ncbi:ketopantoate reductase family protein [Thaumasiovibrio sp. DFM-14]|uniref:ketopantoate reductase family protein n=1 Tax=Thaumasiovibrio sp. DFM-14 TaxID=3384792 RepID=UPI00399F78F7
MNIAILGAGAIGSLLAGLLQQHGHQINLITRSPHPCHINIRHLDGTAHDYPVKVNQPLLRCEMLIVCVKAFQVESALSALSNTLPITTPIVLCHNGMGTASNITKGFPNNPILFASTSLAARRLSLGHIKHTGWGETYIGALTDAHPSPDVITSIFSSAMKHCLWDDNIAMRRWQKLAINCAINPLTAINGIRNGDLEQPQYQRQLLVICEEVSQVMAAEGYSCSPTALFNKVKQVILATADNFSSMYQDIHHQRCSEIDYISGYVIKRAQAHHISVPENEQLWLKIKQREQNYDHN